MAKWLIELKGKKIDLEKFPMNFPGGDFYAIEEDGLFYLTGDGFEVLSDAAKVRDLCHEL